MTCFLTANRESGNSIQQDGGYNLRSQDHLLVPWAMGSPAFAMGCGQKTVTGPDHTRGEEPGSMGPPQSLSARGRSHYSLTAVCQAGREDELQCRHVDLKLRGSPKRSRALPLRDEHKNGE